SGAWRSTAPPASPRCSTTCAASSRAAWRCAGWRGSMTSPAIWSPAIDPEGTRMSQAQSGGLIGVGLLGHAVAPRLVGARVAVPGFDVDAAKNARLAELGGRPAGWVAELAQRCDPIVLAVFTTDQVEDVVERQLLPAAGGGASRIVFVASTCDPDRIAALA